MKSRLELGYSVLFKQHGNYSANICRVCNDIISCLHVIATWLLTHFATSIQEVRSNQKISAVLMMVVASVFAHAQRKQGLCQDSEAATNSKLS